MSPLSRVDPQDGSEIGNENSQEAAQFTKTGKSKNDKFIDMCVRTSDFQEGLSVTEKKRLMTLEWQKDSWKVRSV